MAKFRRRMALWRRLEPRLQIGEDRIECRAQCDQKAPGALAIASAGDVTFPKARGDAAEVLPIAADIAALAQVLGMRAGIAIETPQHVGDIAIDIMEDARRERSTLLSRQRDGRMDPLTSPLLGAFAEQGGVGRPPERGAPSPAHQPPADIVVDRDQVPRCRRRSDDPPDFGRQLLRHPLVGIDFEDPVTAAGVDPGMSACPFPLPGAFDDQLGEPARDLAGSISAAVEYDDDLVGEAEGTEAVGKLALLVVDNDEGREGRRSGPAHAAMLSIERHRRRAPASAASTERPSISVSVVRWSKPGPNIASGGSTERTNAARCPQGAYCSLGLGPNKPRVGVPAAAAMCMSPVSLPINSAHRRSTATAVSRSSLPARSIRRSGGIAASSGSAYRCSCSAANTATRDPGSGPPAAVSRCASSAKRSARHCLPRQFAAGPIAKTGTPGEISASAARSWCGAVHSRGLGGGSRPNNRPSWRTRCSRASPLAITRRWPARNSQASAEPRRSTTRSQRRVATAA